MTFHQLKIFRAVGRHSNVTRAAYELHLSQPCVSTQLKLLESEFGVQLYARKGTGIKLTREGLLFLRRIRPIVQQAEDLQKLFSIKARRQPIIFQIAATQNAAAAVLPAVLADFRKSHLTINLALKTAQSRVVEQLVIHEEVEIGIVTNPSYHSKLVTQSFASEEVVAVVSSRHPLAKKGELTHAELRSTPALVRMGGIIPEELQKAGLDLNVSMECESSDPLKAAVASGFGLGFFYRSTVESDLRSGAFKRIRISGLQEIRVKSVVIYLKTRTLSAHAKDFVALLHCRTQASESDQ
jgi:LysR family transcriptional regulator, transcriptional activator of the cysJI operon